MPQPKLKLLYFNMTGRGEAIRLMCKYAGLELEDYRFSSMDEFQKMKADGTLQFGQVPAMEVTLENGTTHQLVQSYAILNYLAKIGGVYPDDPLVAAKADAILFQDADTFFAPTMCTYPDRFGVCLDDAGKEKTKEQVIQEIMPKHLAKIEKILASSPTGFLAGTEKPTPADFVWYCRLNHHIPEWEHVYPKDFGNFEDYPKIKEFIKKVGDLDAVKKHQGK